MIPHLPKPKLEKEEENKALFVIEALSPGYGATIGNALRRVLLSSLQGSAITKVKVAGASHEYSTISGVYEDVMSILLNLKQLRFRMHDEEPQQATLKVKGEKEVKGKDFDFPTQVELKNPDLHIATLTDKKASLEIEVQIEKGVGYMTGEDMKSRLKGKPEIGVVYTDAIFTPVHKVSFRVENMRVGERTDFDKLFLEVETDGTVSPREAFAKASEILLEHFALFHDTFPSQEEEDTKKKKTTYEKAKKGKKTK